MKWFRSNIKHGARFALFALAVQFALSFGHFHTVSAQASPAGQIGPAPVSFYPASSRLAANPAGESARPQPPSNPDSDQQPADPCAICAVIALANTMLFASPPVLLLPQAVELLRLVTDAEFARLNSASAAFQPRAPPLS
jgi:hypothetical protein